MKKKPRGLTLIERALIAKAVHADAVTAEIHALLGEGADELVNKAGRIMWIVLDALIAEDIDHDMPEVRILRGACNALYEQAGESKVTEARRASIRSGLEAAGRLVGVLPQRRMVDAALALEVRLARQNVDWSDFQGLLGKVAA